MSHQLDVDGAELERFRDYSMLISRLQLGPQSGVCPRPASPRPALAEADDVKRVQSEAEAAASLTHPGIVAVHEVGLHYGRHYFSMDYIEGPSLAEMVRDHPLPARRASGYVRAIAEAVHCAHGQGILHRDRKPSNVLLDAADRVHVADFGMVRRVEGNSKLTQREVIAMTPQSRLNELLLDCVGRLVPHQWPGGDGFTKEDVLGEYPALAARRLVPGEESLHRLHPELAEELASFFSA